MQDPAPPTSTVQYIVRRAAQPHCPSHALRHTRQLGHCTRPAGLTPPYHASSQLHAQLSGLASTFPEQIPRCTAADLSICLLHLSTDASLYSMRTPRRRVVSEARDVAAATLADASGRAARMAATAAALHAQLEVGTWFPAGHMPADCYAFCKCQPRGAVGFLRVRSCCPVTQPMPFRSLHMRLLVHDSVYVCLTAAGHISTYHDISTYAICRSRRYQPYANSSACTGNLMYHTVVSCMHLHAGHADGGFGGSAHQGRP